MSDHWRRRRNNQPFEPTLADTVYLERQTWGPRSFTSQLYWKRGQIEISFPCPRGCSRRGSLIFNEKSFPQGWALQQEACVAEPAVGACCLLAGSVRLSGRMQGQGGMCTRLGHYNHGLASDSLAPGTKALLRCDFFFLNSTLFQEAKVICQISA